jgi:ferric-dicitrate binding protein FerR (iron transport regulator)
MMMNDKLLTKYLLKEASEAEVETAEQWIGAHPENELYYRRLKHLWNASSGIAGKSRLSEDEAWKHFRQKRERLSAVSAVRVIRFKDYIAAACFLSFSVISGMRTGISVIGLSPPPASRDFVHTGLRTST